MPRHEVRVLVLALAAAACGRAEPTLAVRAGDAPTRGPQAAETRDPWLAPRDVPAPELVYDRFETIGVADGLPSERVTTILAEGADLSVGTEAGLALRRGGAWSVISEAQGLAHDYVTSLARDGTTGDLWVSTLRGISRLSAGAVRTWRQGDSGLANDVVYHLVADEGVVWIATAAGLSRFDPRAGSWTLHDPTNSILHEPWCYAVALGPGRAWVGLWGGGVVELDRATGAWKEYRDPDGEMEIDLLADDGPIHEVSSFVAYDAGVLWQSTYFGLSRFDGRRWRTFVAADTGFPGDFLVHAAALGRTVWLSTDRGFAVFDGRTCVSYRRDAEGACDVRTVVEGRETSRRTLATAPADDYALWTQGGMRDVWIATARGLSHGVAGPGEER
jgi:ligand-binding sensor domain-containing protein